MTKFSPTVIIDCQTAGIAGDMILGALIALGADTTKIITAIKQLETIEHGCYSNIQIDIKQVLKKGFKATKTTITSNSKQTPKNGKHLIDIVEKTIQQLNISPKAKQFATNTIHSLINTETNLHGNKLENVHLHEIGAVDTAAEIIGTAVALDDLNLFNAKIYTTPLSIGGGLFKFSHGTISSPSPATIALLTTKKLPFKGGPIETELATPTGTAILINLNPTPTQYYPKIIPVKVGYGAGNKDFQEIPNVLRITIGKPFDSIACINEPIVVLETNVDDISGEIISYTLDRLLTEGAKDVSIIPVITKKNRPANIIKVVADQKDIQHLTEVLIDETGTLGVRIHYCERHIITRNIHLIDLTIAGQKETIKIKCSKNSQGKIIRLKPELEDLKRIAEKTKLPLRELLDLATTKAKQTLMPESD